MRVCLFCHSGFQLSLTTHSSPGLSLLPEIMLSFNRPHHRLFLWRSPSFAGTSQNTSVWLYIVENSCRKTTKNTSTSP